MRNKFINDLVIHCEKENYTILSINENVAEVRGRVGETSMIFKIKEEDLKNINYKCSNLAKINLLKNIETSLSEQMEKLREEHEEFQEAIFFVKHDNAAEEFFDVIQVMFEVMYRLGFSEEKLNEKLIRHNLKLLNRGWEFK